MNQFKTPFFTKRMPLFVFLLLNLFSIQLVAQIIGGRGNGERTPREVKAGTVNKGVVSGDVNLFTGTYSSSYTLGAVSTPSGLSYQATMSYNSTMAGGNNPPLVSGIPYGEGWSMDIPKISISTEDFNKYTLWQKHHHGLARNDGSRPEYDEKDAMKEGELYWYAPQLSIPGQASGRLVYKYMIKNKAVFVLNTFDRYIEARFDGVNWVVLLEDGTQYNMNTKLISHRAASNQRTRGRHNDRDVTNDNSIALSNLLLPKTEVLSWNVTTIRHYNKLETISFRYQGFGCYNFYKEYTYVGTKAGINHNLYERPNAPDILKEEHACKELFLMEIKAGELEKLVFEHESIALDGTVDMLDFREEDVYRKDSLYSYKTVKEYGLENNFEGWTRYQHIESDGIQPSYVSSGTNPYLTSINNCPTYLRENAVTDFTSNLDLSFNHGFLESPRINEGDVFIPGEQYEIKTKLIGDEFCTFDINLATGNTNGSPSCSSSNSDSMSKDQYLKTRDQSVFSTFNQGVKWALQYDGVNNRNLTTSNYFLMPNNPIDYNGFNFQIGPGNADVTYNKTGADLTITGALRTCKAYLPPEYQSFSGSTESSGLVLSAEDNIPNNFGIGVPWYMALPIYNHGRDGVDYRHCESYDNPFGVIVGLENFWHNNDNDPTTNYENQPTKAGEDTKLKSVQFIRHSKNPYMLRRVKKYIKNGWGIFEQGWGVQNNGESVWQLVGHIKMDYEVEQVDRYSYNYIEPSSNNGSVWQILKSNQGRRNIFKLTKVKQLPVNITTTIDETKVPTTQFGYKEVTVGQIAPYVPLSSAGIDIGSDSLTVHSFMLDEIIDPIGHITTIEYQEHARAVKSFMFKLRPDNGNVIGSQIGKSPIMPNAVYQFQFIVKNKKITDVNGTEKTWSYVYSNHKLKDDMPPMHPQFKYDHQYNYSRGFTQTKVYEPALNNIRPYSIHYHKTTENNNLLWGKLYKTEQYDGNGTLVTQQDIEYEAVLAFKGGADRVSRNVLHYDYQDYIEGYTGTGDFSYTYEPYFDTLPQPPVRADYETQSAFVYAYTKWINRFPYLIEPREVDYETEELYKEAYQEWVIKVMILMNYVNSYDGTVKLGQTQDDIKPVPPTYCTTNQQNSDELCNELWNIYHHQMHHWDLIGLRVFALNQNPLIRAAFMQSNRFYEVDRASWIQSHNPTYLNSYFIKKTKEIATVYDYACVEDDNGNMVASNNLQAINTITDYEYYDADYTGKITSEGYQYFITQIGDDEVPTHLKNEPSWQLYSKTTRSSQIPDAYTKEEYFYYYDLINDPTIIDDEAYQPSDDFRTVWLMWLYGMRNYAYQQRTTTKTSGQTPISQSTYIEYDAKWDIVNTAIWVTDTMDNMDTCIRDWYVSGQDTTCLTCPNGSNYPNGYDSTGNEHLGGYYTYGCRLLRATDLNSGYCECGYCESDYSEVSWFCPCNNMPPMRGTSQDEEPSDNGNTHKMTVLEDDMGPYALAPLVSLVEGEVHAKRVYRQVETEVSESYEGQYGVRNNPIMRFLKQPYQETWVVYNPFKDTTVTHTFFKYLPILPHEALKTYEVTKRGMYGQVVLEEDEKGLLTRYDYSNEGRIAIKKCINGEPGWEYRYPYLNRGLPIAITVGVGRADSLRTSYEYNLDNTLKKIIDPNGMELSYEYDIYGRMNKGFQNGELLNEVAYHQWDNKNTDNFQARALKNYVETKTHNDLSGNNYIQARAYVDPLGRDFMTAAKPSTSGLMVIGGGTDLDEWNRPIHSYKSFTKTGDFGSLGYNQHLSQTGLPYATQVHENSLRSRVLKTAKYGVDINSDHIVQNDYCIITEFAVKEELGLTEQEYIELFPNFLTFSNNSLILRFQITDEDGKTAIEFKNGLGQKIATLRYDDNNEKVVTLFIYDSRNNITKVINPEKQATHYRYNYLGQLYEKETVDDGITRYVYGKSGELLYE